MSNKAEILAEYEAAHSELTQLETNAGRYAGTATATQTSNLTQKAHHLSEQCDQLKMILEAIEASED
ncbi:hypothetical protein LOSG293_030630 [Secundilactobacillus oryzae JCM 18671]|uniref:Uncharacterized protein n=1 Tax=Secundilactobacillus oryzae JCM 18671 TaxID=1291743 RepID=A0A081BGQ6_9LACO|nr:hypothetical protein [Secundilactobacillus oryzae]GAK47224.1 hypothetical protein LOSG293_030630 [Secundilactobacillus oryzae JCM 18671]